MQTNVDIYIKSFKIAVTLIKKLFQNKKSYVICSLDKITNVLRNL